MTAPDPLLTWPAPERNKQPIADVLELWLANAASVLEVASGTGQHAVHFARELPHLTWLPTEADTELVDAIAARVALAALPNLKGPRRLELGSPYEALPRVDAVFCANLVHIAPWEVTVALFGLAARILGSSGSLVTYGPYRVGGKHTSESNLDFDAWLKDKDPRFGVRDLDQLDSLAHQHGLVLSDRVPMPANNFCLNWTCSKKWVRAC